jgi:4-hydroxy-tetrahydrodipicolinate reductase
MSKKTLKIALLGYGKMGKEIERIASDRGHEIVAILDKNRKEFGTLSHADVAIEFSIPSAAVSNIEKCFDHNIAVVVGTTGWYKDYERLAERARIEKQALFTATNFSLGVNLFFRLNGILASWMNKYEEYQPRMNEMHHIHKLDAPSGTAITLADYVIKEINRIEKWELLEDGERSGDDHSLPIYSIREGEVPGTHEMIYDGPFDEIIVRHEAKNRSGFALGSVIAAEFVAGKTGVFGMNDLLGFNS